MADISCINIYNQIDSNRRKTFVFIVLFILFIVLLGWIIGLALEEPYLFPMIAFFIAFVASVSSYYFSDKMVLATKGLLQKMDKPELEGVIAHELSHIGNYDIRLMTIVAILAGTVVLLSDLFLRWSW